MAGIVAYGACVPRYRIKLEEIARVWGANAEAYGRGLQIVEKSVAAPDQDAITLAVEASLSALSRSRIDPAEIGAIYVGSESHPYAVKPSGTVVAEAIGATDKVHCADFEFACKAGTEAVNAGLGLVEAMRVKYSLAIGSDTSQGAPGDPLEYATAAGAAAFILGTDDLVATIDLIRAQMTDTPDFWRREGRRYPRHGGRFTGEPAYFRHIVSAASAAMAEAGLKPSDFRYAVFHQPNGKFPKRVGRTLGFSDEQMELGLLSPWIGNAYSASSLLGLCAVLDQAQPGDRILVTSYGSGAGSDAVILTATDRISEGRERAPLVWDMVRKNKKYVDYAIYARFRRKIDKG